MKKILFATTALVATAGAASAEIALTGWAEIGILGGEKYDNVTQFHTDIDVTFTMTGEADNGLTFGAKVDLGENGAFGNTTQGGETYFVAYGGARLDMGDVDGAFDAAMQEVNVAGGSIADDETAHMGFNGNAGMDDTYDGQIATFSYTASGVTGYVSVEVADEKYEGVKLDPVWGIGLKYAGEFAGGKFTVGAGHQFGDQDYADYSYEMSVLGAAMTWPFGASSQQEAEAAVASYMGANVVKSSVTGISARVDLDSGLSFAGNYSETEYADFGGEDVGGASSYIGKTETHWGIGMGYSMNAVTVAVNYGEYNDRYGIKGLTDKGWGIAANYDLGGGLVAKVGYGDSERSYDASIPDSVGFTQDSNSFSVGLGMSF